MKPRDPYIQIQDFYIAQTKFAAISVAIELGIFEAIRKPISLDELSSLMKMSPLILYALSRALESLQLVEFTHDKYFINHEYSQFLLSDSQFFQGKDFASRTNEKLHTRIKNALLKAEPSLNYAGVSLTKMWETGNIDSNTAAEFTEHMQTMMSYPSEVLSKNDTFQQVPELIDLGGGSGAWAMALQKNQPHISIAVFDLPAVLEKAKTNVDERLPGNRIKFHAGNFFESEIPRSKSYLLSNILHDWPLNKCDEIVSKIAKSSETGTLLFINECLLDEDRSSPSFTCFFNLLMAVNHGSQQFALTDLNELLLKNGFSSPTIVAECGYYQLTVSRKL